MLDIQVLTAIQMHLIGSCGSSSLVMVELRQFRIVVVITRLEKFSDLRQNTDYRYVYIHKRSTPLQD